MRWTNIPLRPPAAETGVIRNDDNITMLLFRILTGEGGGGYSGVNISDREKQIRPNVLKVDPTIVNILELKNKKSYENDILFSEWHRHTQKKEIRVLLSGVEPKTFRLLVRMLYH